MGNYGVDSAFNNIQAQTVIRTYNLIPEVRSLGDQWTLDSANAVMSFHDGLKVNNIQVKFNPNDLEFS